MKITDITLQARNPNRVNISIDGKYRFSLDVLQVGELGLKRDQEIDEVALALLEEESSFGKLYARALEYSFMRPRSTKELRDYLWKKTLDRKYRAKDGTVKERQGISTRITERVLERLVEKGYVNDEAFARFWVENRHQRTGTSRRKLQAELMAKGVDRSIIEQTLSLSDRTEDDELQKMIAKKRTKYEDEVKLMQYLVRQGFSYDAVRDALNRDLD